MRAYLNHSDSRFASPGLAVGNESAVVPLHNLLQHRANNFMVYQGLVCFRTEYEVKGVCASGWECDDSKARDGGCSLDRDVLTFRAFRRDDNWRVVLYFSLGSSPAADDDLYVGLRAFVGAIGSG